jgi:hypothetical protein
MEVDGVEKPNGLEHHADGVMAHWASIPSCTFHILFRFCFGEFLCLIRLGATAWE